MDAEMKEALRGYDLSWQSREGAPYSAADLTRVSAGSAAMIVLLRPDNVSVSHTSTPPPPPTMLIGILAQSDLNTDSVVQVIVHDSLGPISNCVRTFVCLCVQACLDFCGVLGVASCWGSAAIFISVPFHHAWSHAIHG